MPRARVRNFPKKAEYALRKRASRVRSDFNIATLKINRTTASLSRSLTPGEFDLSDPKNKGLFEKISAITDHVFKRKETVAQIKELRAEAKDYRRKRRLNALKPSKGFS